MIYFSHAKTLPALISSANAEGITKDKIVTILKVDEGYVLIYES